MIHPDSTRSLNAVVPEEFKEPEETKSDASELEIAELDKLLASEKSHYLQWPKHLIAFSLTIISLLISFMRGSKSTPSIIGVAKCSPWDWGLLAIFCLLMFGFSGLGVYLNIKEQKLKVKVGRGLHEKDLRFAGKKLFYLLFFAFVGGWVSGALGLGGGSIYNPLMISLGVPPSVSTSTGMYMIMLSTAASSIIYISYGVMPIGFSIWLSVWSSAGIVSGIVAINHVMKKTARQSILVFIMTIVLFLSLCLVPI